jgi:Protein of unknown function (DUF2806)
MAEEPGTQITIASGGDIDRPSTIGFWAALDQLGGSIVSSGTVAANAAKALASLCTAAANIPKAGMDRLAAHISETGANKRREARAASDGRIAELEAATQQRVRLTQGAGDQLVAGQIVDPVYVRAAAAKAGERILQEQVNLDQIGESAAQKLLEAGNLDRQADTVDTDFLFAFANTAKEKSSEDMREMFARVLAGEIQHPGTFSPRSVKLLGELSREDAVHFRTFVSCAMFYEGFPDGRVWSIKGRPGQNSLSPFGLSFGVLTQLNDLGLVQSTMESHVVYNASARYGEDAWAGIPVWFGGRPYIFESSRQLLEGEPQMEGPGLTRAGVELAKVVDRVDARSYFEWLQMHLRDRGMRLVEIGDEYVRPNSGGLRMVHLPARPPPAPV